jgi:hypothetical protein
MYAFQKRMIHDTLFPTRYAITPDQVREGTILGIQNAARTAAAQVGARQARNRFMTLWQQATAVVTAGRLAAQKRRGR